MNVRVRQALALARDWVAPGPAIAQWTHFVTSVCNARCAHCFYPINAGKNELILAFGARYKVKEWWTIGAGVEWSVVQPSRNLEDFRLTADMIFRY